MEDFVYSVVSVVVLVVLLLKYVEIVIVNDLILWLVCKVVMIGDWI